jgi:hypothetical protein
MYSSCGLIRSVVVNKENKVVSFSPPKCISYDDFIEKYPVYNENIIVEELVEGTMIQLFWDSYDCKWEIATKSSIGGYNINTFSKMSFRDMFFDSLKEMNLSLDMFNHKYCYSFVLQHPKNHIVFDIVKPQLYLLYVYNINHVYNVCDDIYDDISSPVSGIEEINIHVHHLINSVDFNAKIDFSKDCKIKYPIQFLLNENMSYKDIFNYFYNHSYDLNMVYSTMGFVLYNNVTGERCKIRNPYYEHMHNINGMQSKLLYKYLIFRYQNNENQFIQFYKNKDGYGGNGGNGGTGGTGNNDNDNGTDIKSKVDVFKTKIHSFTNILLIHYIDCFINKSKSLASYPPQYKSHMYELHNMYLKELKPNKRIIDIRTVMLYVNNLHPSKLIYSLIYKKSKTLQK